MCNEQAVIQACLGSSFCPGLRSTDEIKRAESRIYKGLLHRDKNRVLLLQHCWPPFLRYEFLPQRKSGRKIRKRRGRGPGGGSRFLFCALASPPEESERIHFLMKWVREPHIKSPSPFSQLQDGSEGESNSWCSRASGLGESHLWQANGSTDSVTPSPRE